MDWLKQLLTEAGLYQEGDTEETMKTAIAGLIADRAKLAEAQQAASQSQEAATQAANERDGIKEQLTAANERYTKHCLDLAVQGGRIAVAQRPEWEGKFAADPIVAANELEAVKPQISTASKVKGLGLRKAGESNQGSDKIIAINEAVAEAAKKGGFDLATNEGHSKAFAAAKKAKPELFATN